MDWLRSVSTTLGVGVLAALLVTGCTRAVTVTAAPRPTPSLTPTPSSTELTTTALQPLVDAATIPANGLTTAGAAAKPSTDQTGPTAAYLPCARVATTAPAVAGHYRFWSTKTVVSQIVSGYGQPLAPDVVRDARAAAVGCKTFTNDGEPHEMLGEVSLPAYTGVPATYAWCEKYRYQKATYVRCHAVLAKGHLLSEVTVYAGDALASGGTALRPVVAVAANALAATRTPE